MNSLNSNEQFNFKEIPPTDKINRANERLTTKGYQLKKIGESFVVSKNADTFPLEESEKIVNFLKPIDYWELTGHCTQRSAECVFNNVASYAYERPFDNKNTGIIPPGYHMIAGKRLENQKYLAFDPVSRAVIFSTSSSDNNPLAQTIFFYGDSEAEVVDMLNHFYGGQFSKVEIPDTPYERHIAKRRINQ